MDKLLVVDSLDLHVYTICFATAFILTDPKGLPTFRGSLVDNVKFTGRVLFEKIAENKFGFCLTV